MLTKVHCNSLYLVDAIAPCRQRFLTSKRAQQHRIYCNVDLHVCLCYLGLRLQHQHHPLKEVFVLTVQDIDLSGCQLVTDLGIRALTQSCRNLESVNVSSCYELSDAAFESLGTCRGLRSLDACGCEQLTDAGLRALSQGARYA